MERWHGCEHKVQASGKASTQCAVACLLLAWPRRAHAAAKCTKPTHFLAGGLVLMVSATSHRAVPTLQAWSEHDPCSTGYIPAASLSLLIMELEPPLGVRGSNRPRLGILEIIMSMDIPNRDQKVRLPAMTLGSASSLRPLFLSWAACCRHQEPSHLGCEYVPTQYNL